jgi:hypothetical protein
MLQKIQFFDKKDPKLSLSELLSWWHYSNLFIWPSIWTRLEHAHCLETINNCSAHLSSKIFANSARVWTRSTSLSSFQRSNWSPTYILHLFHLEDTSLLFIFHVGDQLDRWNELKEVLRVQTRAEVATILQSFFIFYEFMMMSMIIFGRYYSIYVIKYRIFCSITRC